MSISKKELAALQGRVLSKAISGPLSDYKHSLISALSELEAEKKRGEKLDQQLKNFKPQQFYFGPSYLSRISKDIASVINNHLLFSKDKINVALSCRALYMLFKEYAHRQKYIELIIESRVAPGFAQLIQKQSQLVNIKGKDYLPFIRCSAKFLGNGDFFKRHCHQNVDLLKKNRLITDDAQQFLKEYFYIRDYQLPAIYLGTSPCMFSIHSNLIESNKLRQSIENKPVIFHDLLDGSMLTNVIKDKCTSILCALLVSQTQHPAKAKKYLDTLVKRGDPYHISIVETEKTLNVATQEWVTHYINFINQCDETEQLLLNCEQEIDKNINVLLQVISNLATECFSMIFDNLKEIDGFDYITELYECFNQAKSSIFNSHHILQQYQQFFKAWSMAKNIELNRDIPDTKKFSAWNQVNKQYQQLQPFCLSNLPGNYFKIVVEETSQDSIRTKNISIFSNNTIDLFNEENKDNILRDVLVDYQSIKKMDQVFQTQLQAFQQQLEKRLQNQQQSRFTYK